MKNAERFDECEKIGAYINGLSDLMARVVTVGNYNPYHDRLPEKIGVAMQALGELADSIKPTSDDVQMEFMVELHEKAPDVHP